MLRWRPSASSLRDAFVAVCAVWVVLLVVAPYLASRAHASPLAGALVIAVYGIGSLVCHQLPERSLHLWAAQMPVCARCAGIYVGALIGAVSARSLHPRPPSSESAQPVDSSGARRVDRRSFWHQRAGGTAARPGFGLRHARVLLGLAALPTAITLVYEWSTTDMPSHAIRAAAGAAIGLVVAWLVVAAAENQVN